MLGIINSVIGLFAFLLFAVGYAYILFVPPGQERKTVLLFHLGSTALYAIHYGMLPNASTGLYINIVSFTRQIILLIFVLRGTEKVEKSKLSMYFSLCVLLLLYTAIAAATWVGIEQIGIESVGYRSIFTGAASILFTLVFFIHRQAEDVRSKIIKWQIVVSALLITYNLSVGSLVLAATEALVIFLCILIIIKGDAVKAIVEPNLYKLSAFLMKKH